MDVNSSKIKLNDNDRKIINNNSNICTDSHGEGCGTMDTNERNEALN